MTSRAACNDCEAQTAMLRMSRAGAELVRTFTLGCEFQADGWFPTADALFDPFREALPGLGLGMQRFWNNANQWVVPDPFGGIRRRCP